jgi:polysaccharide export outer membrane protein
MGIRTFILPIIFTMVAACASQAPTNLPHGAAAYKVIPVNVAASVPQDYRIGPLDTLDIKVFQEPELSAEKVMVDAAGNIAVPMLGQLEAKGKTASELGREMERRYSERILQNPQVTVVVATSISQKVAVQGEVTEPGVYDLRGPTTLLEALSMAKGETRVAALKEVVVFRTIAGQRQGAVFDVESIRRGESNDPAVLGNDVVVVGFSSAKGMWRDLLTTAPLLNVFRPIAMGM